MRPISFMLNFYAVKLHAFNKQFGLAQLAGPDSTDCNAVYFEVLKGAGH